MKRLLILTVLVSIILSACAGPSTPQVSVQQATETHPPTSTSTSTPIIPTSTPAPTATLSIPQGYLDSAIPVSGGYVAKLETLDKALLGFIEQRNIGAAQLVVIKNGVVVLNHAYGWYDVEHTHPFTTDGVMRIASVTKPITMAAIRNLLEEGKLHGTQNVFCVDGSPADCLLKIEPLPGAKIDPNLKDITVNQLLEHKGGWDRDASFDPMFASIRIAHALKVQSPPDKYQIAQFMLGQPLDFKPGTKEVYSNFGYSLLGQIIEKVTGKTYIQYVQEDIFSPLGVKDVYLGATSLDKRQPNEPYYTCTGKGENVFKPGSQVCWPDGGWSIEGMDAHGGLVTSANSLGTFLNAYCIDGKHASRPGSCGDFTFFGSLDGTLSLVSQRPDGINYVLILNSRWDKKNGDYDNVKQVIDSELNLIREWP